MNMVTSTDIQRNFKKILDSDEPVIVMRDSKPRKVIMDYDSYMQIEKKEKEARNEEFFAMLKKIHARNAHIPAEEVERDVEEALKYVRAHNRRRGH